MKLFEHTFIDGLHCPGMLVHNYRSHSRLLELPSRLYYDNSLVASADPSLVAAPLWDELQDPNDQHPNEEEQHADKGTVRNSEDQQNMEGLVVEEAQDADEEEHELYGEEAEDYDEGEEGGVDQLPVNTLFYGVRGQQVPCS